MTEIVAEIGGNHSGAIRNALTLISEAKKAGADTVKFQCFDPAKLALRRANNPEVLAEANGRDLLTLYKRIHTPRAWFPSLIQRVRTHNMQWFSSVFDPDDVRFLETIDCPRYKLSAFEMLDWELIRAVKRTGKPIIMSVRPTDRVTVLAASDYKGAFPALGLSWHTATAPSLIVPLHNDVPMVEWHIRLEHLDTPDKDFSMTGDEMKKAIEAIRGTDHVQRSA